MFTIIDICSGIFFLAGLAILFTGFRTYQRSKQAANWLTVTGKVTTSKLINPMGNDRKQYARIEYEYSVLGTNYVSNKISFSQLMGFDDTALGTAEEKVKKFPAGRSVTVYYDPQEPQRAVLETGGNSGLLILGGLFLAAALAFYFIQ
ncbi:MAG: DUF3592 domain-containing protein [Anaerolineales bacterium]